MIWNVLLYIQVASSSTDSVLRPVLKATSAGPCCWHVAMANSPSSSKVAKLNLEPRVWINAKEVLEACKLAEAFSITIKCSSNAKRQELSVVGVSGNFSPLCRRDPRVFPTLAPVRLLKPRGRLQFYAAMASCDTSRTFCRSTWRRPALQWVGVAKMQRSSYLNLFQYGMIITVLRCT